MVHAHRSGRCLRANAVYGSSPIQPYLDYDSDGDGIPDTWMTHTSASTGLASDRSRAQDDADGEGMSNSQEYLAGTDPLDRRAALSCSSRVWDPARAGRKSFSRHAGDWLHPANTPTT